MAAVHHLPLHQPWNLHLFRPAPFFLTWNSNFRCHGLQKWLPIHYNPFRLPLRGAKETIALFALQCSTRGPMMGIKGGHPWCVHLIGPLLQLGWFSECLLVPKKENLKMDWHDLTPFLKSCENENKFFYNSVVNKRMEFIIQSLFLHPLGHEMDLTILYDAVNNGVKI